MNSKRLQVVFNIIVLNISIMFNIAVEIYTITFILGSIIYVGYTIWFYSDVNRCTCTCISIQNCIHNSILTYFGHTLGIFTGVFLNLNINNDCLSL